MGMDMCVGVGVGMCVNVCVGVLSVGMCVYVCGGVWGVGCEMYSNVCCVCKCDRDCVWMWQYFYCSDTVSCGMFGAIATTIELCKTKGVVDVFQVVKALRVQKTVAVRTVVSLASQRAVSSVCVCYIINPRRACAARVTVLGLSFCLSVILSVCPNTLFWQYARLKVE